MNTNYLYSTRAYKLIRSIWLNYELKFQYTCTCPSSQIMKWELKITLLYTHTKLYTMYHKNCKPIGICGCLTCNKGSTVIGQELAWAETYFGSVPKVDTIIPVCDEWGSMIPALVWKRLRWLTTCRDLWVRTVISPEIKLTLNQYSL